MAQVGTRSTSVIQELIIVSSDLVEALQILVNILITSVLPCPRTKCAGQLHCRFQNLYIGAVDSSPSTNSPLGRSGSHALFFLREKEISISKRPLLWYHMQTRMGNGRSNNQRSLRT